MIVAGRQLDPELREPLAHLARAAGFPILAEPTSQLRCGPHDRSYVVSAYDHLLRDESFREAMTPDLVLRFGEMPTSKPLRTWLADLRRGRDRRRPELRLERADPPRRRAAASRPDRAGRRAGQRASARTGRRRPGGSRPSRAAREALEAELAGTRRADRARTSPRPRPRPPRRRPGLHRVEHADPRPGGLSRPFERRRPLPLQPRRQRHRRPRLLGHRRRPRLGPADHDRHRRPRPPARRRRPRRTPRRLHTRAHRRHRQRRRRHLRLPAPGRGAARRRSSRRCSAPRAGSTWPRPRTSSACPTGASNRCAGLARGAGTRAPA